MTPAEALARLYDLDLQDDPGDLELWTALAAEADGPVLELMAGSGRIAVPLAEEGHEVTAVDLDLAMLARARTRAEAAGAETAERLTLVAADVAAPDLGWAPVPPRVRGPELVLLLSSRAAQRAAWETLAAHLAPGGVAAVDTWLPDAHDLARYDGRLHLEYYRPDPETGRWVTKMAAAQHDARQPDGGPHDDLRGGRPGRSPPAAGCGATSCAS